MKSSNDSFEEIDGVVNKYRPLLQSLDFRHLPKCKKYTEVQKFRNIFLSKCVIVTMRETLPEGTDGYFLFINDKQRNLFILTIKIDDRLFSDNMLKSQSMRKVVGVHEFTHCVAIMLCLSKMAENPNPLLENLVEKIKNKVEVYGQDNFSNLLNSVLKDISKTSKKKPTATDSHFRIGYEDFKNDYADLYTNFLFSYPLFLEYFKDCLIEYEKSNENEKKDVLEHISKNLSELVKNKAIVLEVAIIQFTIFLQRFFLENTETKLLRSL